ncbi:MAG: nicotinate-nucleotide adenylyltransferase [Gammaproteobacteria bacterium]|nr:nicotinate-nucleotide adenylyltransferase [Gammaproteobacteria bacterium]
MYQCIGIYGGTFDPIHYGHLRPVMDVYEKYRLDHIRFIPSAIPPHRQTPDTSTQLRVKLLSTAIDSISAFKLDLREVERGGQSYMFDTLQSLRQDFTEYSLVLILGLDAFLNLPQWHRWKELLNYCHIIVTQRPNHEIPTKQFSTKDWPEIISDYYHQFACHENSMLHKTLCGRIFLTEVTQLDISSSNIRERIKNKQSIDFLVPEKVKNLINKNNLYQSN